MMIAASASIMTGSKALTLLRMVEASDSETGRGRACCRTFNYNIVQAKIMQNEHSRLLYQYSGTKQAGWLPSG